MNANTRFPFALALAAAVLALLLAWLWLAPGRPAQWRHWQPPPPQPPALADAQQAMLHFEPRAQAPYPQVLARPLFMPSRRPPPPVADTSAGAQPPSQPLDSARLLGIMASPALTGVLIEYEGRTQMVRTGADLGGWRLTDVRERTAHFARGSEQRTLELPFLPASAAAGTSPPPAAAPAVATARPSATTPPPRPVQPAAPARASAP
ncbi:MAG: hypothetical protein Q4F13_05915, partial [Pseudomonadota bacterium]|nr:hypothetical protein [Pseudomonadota bacterium]